MSASAIDHGAARALAPGVVCVSGGGDSPSRDEVVGAQTKQRSALLATQLDRALETKLALLRRVALL